MTFGVVLNAVVAGGVLLSAAKWAGWSVLANVSWFVVSYPIYGTLAGVFLLGFCERYVPADYPDDDRLAPS